MNPLSWLIYFAGVAEGLGVLFLVSAIALTLFLFLSYIFCDTYRGDYSGPKRLTIWLAPIIFTLGFLAALMPSQNTVYAIAASELGEEVLKSETGTLAQKALNAWLQKQINEAAPPA